jgi:hypothetical protein
MLPAREGSLWIADLLGRTLTPRWDSGSTIHLCEQFPADVFTVGG